MLKKNNPFLYESYFSRSGSSQFPPHVWSEIVSNTSILIRVDVRAACCMLTVNVNLLKVINNPTRIIALECIMFYTNCT